jgi:hypothetical protein
MSPRLLALLRVIAALGGGIAVFVLASRFVSPWLVAVLFAVVIAGALWIQQRRVCCYLCRGNLDDGSGAYWINGRKRLVCRACEKINGIPPPGKRQRGS